MPVAAYPQSLAVVSHAKARELQRLEAVDRYKQALAGSSALHDVVRLTASVFDAPMAAVAFIDANQQRIHSSVGIRRLTVPLREAPLCLHTLRHPAGVFIEDAAADPRFASCAMVQGAHGVRFYAGVPLSAPSGHRLGTLCVMDTAPRPATDSKSRLLLLRDLAGTAQSILQMCRRADEHARNEAFHRLRASLLADAPPGTPLQPLLVALLDALEQQVPHAFGAIVLQEGAALTVEAASNEPEAYRHAVVAADPATAPLLEARAIRERKAVFSTDLRADGSWAEALDDAAPPNANAGWAVPIVPTSSGKAEETGDAAPVGALSIYYASAQRPTPDEQALVDRYSTLAGQVVARRRHEQDEKARKTPSERIPPPAKVDPALHAGVEDIVSLHRRERHPRRQKETLQKMLDAIPVLLFFIAPDGTPQRVNPQWEETMGWSEAETCAHPNLMEATYPDPDVRAEAHAFMQEAPHAWREFPTTTRTGDTRRILWTNRVLSDGTRMGIGVDITEQKRMQAKLQESETRWHRLVEQHPGPIFVSVEGVFRYVNPAALRVFGAASADDLLGEQVFNFLPAEVRTVMRERQQQIERREPTLPMQHPMIRLDGTERIVVTRSVPVQYQGKEAAQTVVEDITEQVRRAEALERAKDKAEEMNRLKTAFLANMSHEVRTPLTAIMGLAEAIRDASPPAPSDRFADLIHRSGTRLMQTLNAVLDLSKIKAGALTLTPEAFSVVREVEQITRLFQGPAKEADVSLHADLSDVAAPRAVLDPGALASVLNNLIGNAIKFTEPGGRVTVRASDTVDAITLVVEDTGIGMSADFLGRLFQPFQQESSGTTRTHEGSGLGLAIAHELVDMMGGRIDVESARGEGTRFTVVVPRGDT